MSRAGEAILLSALSSVVAHSVACGTSGQLHISMAYLLRSVDVRFRLPQKVRTDLVAVPFSSTLGRGGGTDYKQSIGSPIMSVTGLLRSVLPPRGLPRCKQKTVTHTPHLPISLLPTSDTMGAAASSAELPEAHQLAQTILKPQHVPLLTEYGHHLHLPLLPGGN